MVSFLLGINVAQFFFFLFATAYVPRRDPMIWLYAFNVVVGAAAMIVGFLNISGVVF